MNHIRDPPRRQPNRCTAQRYSACPSIARQKTLRRPVRLVILLGMEKKTASSSLEIQSKMEALEEEIMELNSEWNGPYSVEDEAADWLTAQLEQFGITAVPVLCRIAQLRKPGVRSPSTCRRTTAMRCLRTACGIPNLRFLFA
jgi:hypothetical protein